MKRKLLVQESKQSSTKQEQASKQFATKQEQTSKQSSKTHEDKKLKIADKIYSAKASIDTNFKSEYAPISRTDIILEPTTPKRKRYESLNESSEESQTELLSSLIKRTDDQELFTPKLEKNLDFDTYFDLDLTKDFTNDLTKDFTKDITKPSPSLEGFSVKKENLQEQILINKTLAWASQKERIIGSGSKFLDISRINENSKAPEFSQELRDTIIKTLEIKEKNKHSKKAKPRKKPGAENIINIDDSDDECCDRIVKPELNVGKYTIRTMLTGISSKKHTHSSQEEGPFLEKDLSSQETKGTNGIKETKGTNGTKKKTAAMLHFKIGDGPDAFKITTFGYQDNVLKSGDFENGVNGLRKYNQKNGKSDIKKNTINIISKEKLLEPESNMHSSGSSIPKFLTAINNGFIEEVTVDDLENYTMTTKQKVQGSNFLNRLQWLLNVVEPGRRPLYKDSVGYKKNKGEKEQPTYAAREFVLFNLFSLLELWTAGHISAQEFFSPTLNMSANEGIKSIPETKLESILMNAWNVYLQKMHPDQYHEAHQKGEHIFLSSEYLHVLYKRFTADKKIHETPNHKYLTPERKEALKKSKYDDNSRDTSATFNTQLNMNPKPTIKKCLSFDLTQEHNKKFDYSNGFLSMYEKSKVEVLQEKDFPENNLQGNDMEDQRPCNPGDTKGAQPERSKHIMK